MIGLRIGPAIGIATGQAIGLGVDELSPGISSTTLSLSLIDSVDPVITAVNFTYAAIVTNSGSSTATTVSAVVTLDSSLTFVSGSGSGWTVNAVGQVVTCTRATLAVGVAPTITITVTSGGSALTASSTLDASASNAPAATQVAQSTVVKLVSRDAAGSFRVPASLTEWQSFNAYHVAIGTANYPNVAPASLYLCQEASGNLADSIDAVTLTANGTPLYQQTVTNCTRKGVGFNSGVNQRFTAAAAIGPNPTTTSTMWLWRIDVTSAGAGTGGVLLVSDGTTNCRLLITTTPRLQMAVAGVTNNGTSDPNTGSTMWIDLQYDRTNSRAMCHTGQEKITGTYSALVIDGRKGLGGVASWNGHAVYGVRFDGASSELSDAQIKALHTALNEGTAPPWS